MFETISCRTVKLKMDNNLTLRSNKLKLQGERSLHLASSAVISDSDNRRVLELSDDPPIGGEMQSIRFQCINYEKNRVHTN